MKITDVRVRKFFSEGPVKAIVSITLDDCFAVHDIKIVCPRDKMFVVMPSEKMPDGTHRDIVHPINTEFRQEITKEILEQYEAQKAAHTV